MPAASAIAIVFASGRLGPLERIAPLVVLSGLAVVVAAGDRVPLYRERMVSSTWLGLLVAPPALIVLGIALLPWTLRVDLKISQPANVEGRFFADNFQRRTGKPLDFRHRRCPARAADRAWRARAGRMSISTGRRNAARGRARPISRKDGGLLVWPAPTIPARRRRR